MSNPEFHQCRTCGYEWRHGQHGGHSCADTLLSMLSATQQKLEAAEDAVRLLKIDNILSKERAESAEASIKASQEQEPVGYRCEWPHSGGDNYAPGVHIILIEIGTDEGEKDYMIAVQDGYRLDALYAAPVIPPDVADLQRENAELTRKLAEQQAVMKNYDFDESDYAELNKLLAEAKSKAVPEVTNLMALAFHRALTDGSIGSGEVEEIKIGLRAAMLAAAP